MLFSNDCINLTVATADYSKYRSKLMVLFGTHSLLNISQSWEDTSTLLKRSRDLTPPQISD